MIINNSSELITQVTLLIILSMYYFNVKKEVKQGENSILWFTSFILFVPSNALEFILEAFNFWKFSRGCAPRLKTPHVGKSRAHQKIFKIWSPLGWILRHLRVQKGWNLWTTKYYFSLFYLLFHIKMIHRKYNVTCVIN